MRGCDRYRANLLVTANTGTTDLMARRTPERSTIKRAHTVAYSRKQKPDGTDDGDDEVSDADVVKAALATMKADKEAARPTMKIEVDTVDMPEQPTEPVRARVSTVGVPLVGADFGAPPEMPVEVEQSPVPARGGVVEDPTYMPGPRDIPSGNPDDLAPPPGLVPPGDSRSLRRRGAAYEFALVYRRANAVISRVGVVGTRGIWRVVEYPTTASASHAYAKEASRFVSEGFSDYRE